MRKERWRRERSKGNLDDVLCNIREEDIPENFIRRCQEQK